MRVEAVEPVKKTVQLNYIGNRSTGDCLAEMVEEVAYLLRPLAPSGLRLVKTFHNLVLGCS